MTCRTRRDSRPMRSRSDPAERVRSSKRHGCVSESGANGRSSQVRDGGVSYLDPTTRSVRNAVPHLRHGAAHRDRRPIAPRAAPQRARASSCPTTRATRGAGPSSRVLVVSLLVVVLDNTVLNIALPTIQKDLGASQSELIWAVDAYVLVFAALLFTWGVLGDRYGRKRILVIGLMMFGIASAVCAFSANAGDADRLPRGHGHRRRRRPAGDPRDHHRGLPARTSAAGRSACGPRRSAAPSRSARCSAACCCRTRSGRAGSPATTGARSSSSTCRSWPSAWSASGGSSPRRRTRTRSASTCSAWSISVVGLVSLVYGIIHASETLSWTSASVRRPDRVRASLVLAVFVVYEARSDHKSFDVDAVQEPRLRGQPHRGQPGVLRAVRHTFTLPFYLQTLRGYTTLRPACASSRSPSASCSRRRAAPRWSAVRLPRGDDRRACSWSALSLFALSPGCELDTPLWRCSSSFFLFGFGMGNVIAPGLDRHAERAAAGPRRRRLGRAEHRAPGVRRLRRRGHRHGAGHPVRQPRGRRARPAAAQARATASTSVAADPAGAGEAEAAGAPAAVVDNVRAGAYDAFLSASHFTDADLDRGHLVAAAWSSLPAADRSHRRQPHPAPHRPRRGALPDAEAARRPASDRRGVGRARSPRDRAGLEPAAVADAGARRGADVRAASRRTPRSSTPRWS